MSVKRCQMEIDSSEFAEWIAFSNIEPIGDKRGDLQAGIISNAIASCHVKKPPSPIDFMFDFDKNKNNEDNGKNIARMMSAYGMGEFIDGNSSGSSDGS